jgi:hypothetical protein
VTAPESHEPNTLEEILLRRKRRAVRNGALLLAAVAAGVGLYFALAPEPEPAPTPPPTPVTPRPIVLEPIAPPLPAADPEPAAIEPAAPPEPPLPSLDDSDSLVHGLVEALSSNPKLGEWLATEELIRRFVAAVDSLAEGKSPRPQLDPLWPEERFSVIRVDDILTIAPNSYRRYDLITEVFASLDTEGTVETYRRLAPLVAEAYADLGYPDRGFDETLAAAIRELLRAPRLEGKVEVAPRVISYEYTDWELEGLSAAQRQLIRMGPQNVARVQKKLRELAAALDIPERELPRGGVYKAKPKLDPELRW